MRRNLWFAAVLASVALLAQVSPSRADRTVSTRTSGQKSSGARTDMTVPYLNNGRSAFNAYSVAPRIYSSPTVDDPKNPQAKPVFNIIFYGSKQGFGDRSNGATPRSR